MASSINTSLQVYPERRRGSSQTGVFPEAGTSKSLAPFRHSRRGRPWRRRVSSHGRSALWLTRLLLRPR
jgi:hypothetical protein